MFLLDCRRCRTRRLVTAQRIRAVRNLAAGVIALELSCYCGEPAILITGRAAVTKPD